ncbi:MAG: hypothetical protein K0Q89_1220, partial [Thermomicrobiales bacterium]|nr:hypothetical protein [Thermomicrobiales bacterium]
RANPVDEEQILIAAASPGDTFRKYEGKQAFGQPMLRVFDHRNRGNPAIAEENDVTDFDERAMLKLAWGRCIVAERERIG